MFRLSDFLIYCFITAYSPGANNLLSMSNAMRLGFSRSIRFNFGITAGFSIVMALCTIFSAALYSLLPKVKIVMQVLGAAYMLYLCLLYTSLYHIFYFFEINKQVRTPS